MKEEKKKWTWGKVIGFLVLIWIISFIISAFFTSSDIDSDSNVAVIKVYGMIRSTGSSGFTTSSAISNDIVALLDKADKNPRIKAIVLDINSGGGSAVASDEIGQKIKSINKTTVAWIREVGASGAYWIASSTDQIIANRMSIVGSIGVTGSYLEFAKLLEDYNVTYRRLVSGKYKDTGSPFKELTKDEEALIQGLVDELFVYFKEEVAGNRNLSIQKVDSLATGEVFSGAKGQKLGLIDQLGGIEEVSKYLEKELNVSVKYTTFEKKEGLADILRRIVNEQSFFMGKGIGSFLNNDVPLIRT